MDPPRRLSRTAMGMLVIVVGVTVLSPDALLIRLIDLPPWNLAFWRGSLAALVLFALLAAYYGTGVFRAVAKTGKAGLVSSVLFGLRLVLFVFAIANTTAANTLIIISSAPMIAAVMSRLFLAEPVSPGTWMAIAGASVGVAVSVVGQVDMQLLGDLFALAGAFSLAGQITVLRYAKDRDMIPTIASGAALSAIFAYPLTTTLAVPASELGLVIVLGAVVLPVAYFLTSLGPRFVPAPQVTLLLLLEVVLGPYWVWLVVGETPGVSTLVGGLMVILALTGHSWLALRRHQRQRLVV